MLIQIHESIFANPDATKAATLCIILANSRHIVFFDNSTQSFKNWALKVGVLGVNVQNYLLRSVTQIISQGIHNRVIVHDGNTNWEHDLTAKPQKIATLSHSDALKFCSMPAKIFVENAESDRAFILAFLNKSKRSILNTYEANGWVQFIHGGGIGDLKKHIEKEVLLFPGASIRCFAIFDGDALIPGFPSSQAISVSEICVQYSMPFHQLSRRCIENYLPGNLLMIRQRTMENHNGHSIALFCKLPDSIRDHFNMKGGLDRDERHKGKKPTFPTAHMYAIKKFAKGFGDKAWQGFSDKNFDVLERDNDKDICRSKIELDPPLKKLMEQL